MTILQTLIFAIIQGISELFPVSSVAHGVFVPYVFHWNLGPEFLQQHFLSYVVMLHLGTAIALFIFFWREWVDMIRSIFIGNRKVLLLLIVATIPAAVIGLVLEKPLTRIFSNVTSASIFLILNGFFLFYGEKLRSKGTKEIQDLTMKQALIVGLFQSLALVPGFSRSGSSMTAGFWMGLKHESAARFSMLMATPIIAGASILEIPKLVKSGTHGLLQMSLLGGFAAGIFAFLSVWILMKWFKRKEIQAMRPFAYYCWIAGALILLSRLLFA
ncbi:MULTISPECIES: undecaprenyl-diphosphate phosphatase [unclassified Sporolactobacillus]|uniref:undecaprenyl-diphosphate phosphatase n=1 Tax=unclassified Sporolactobacillus TaxID=2628533 RepID=UPI002368D0F3|nr:undecaprenyl-diphosphate phosphatase [Sporolactobacillus sp. CQH2019]MDD9149157.1 undecaprenyl-diphosphate phosphatase [Sporolactobacillus sp. CQH2019]